MLTITIASDIFEANTGTATRKGIAQCMDLAILQEALVLEEARPKGGRSTITGWLKFRINVLESLAADAETNGDDTTVTESTDQPPESIDDDSGDDDDDDEEAEVVTPERTEVETCAFAFVGALATGNPALVGELLKEFRSNESNDEEAAAALIKAFGSQPKRRSSGTRSKTQWDPNAPASTLAVERITKAITAAVFGEDGVGKLDVDGMTTAGLPKYWQDHGSNWSKAGQAGRAARAAGYTTSLRKDGDDRVVVFTPIVTDEEPASA